MHEALTFSDSPFSIAWKVVPSDVIIRCVVDEEETTCLEVTTRVVVVNEDELSIVEEKVLDSSPNTFSGASFSSDVED